MRTRNVDKEQLVKQQAIEMIVRDGLEGFSMNKLAKACNVSVATLYIYYKDRDDLILRIAVEEGRQMSEAMIKGLDPESLLEDGLRQQWINRYNYLKSNPKVGLFLDQLRSSSYQDAFLPVFLKDFQHVVGKFMHNVIARGEMEAMPLEVYWSIAFAPLYALIRFDNEGQSLGGKPFKMTDEILWKTFELAVKALRK